MSSLLRVGDLFEIVKDYYDDLIFPMSVIYW